MPTNQAVTSPVTGRRIMLIRNAQPYDFGGGERFPVDLAAELVKLGAKPLIVSRSPKLLDYAHDQAIPTVRGWWWSRQNWSGRRLLLVPLYFGWLILLSVWYLQLMIRHKPDIIHAQSKDDFIAASVIGRLLGKKIIWTDHADLKYIYQNHPVPYKNPVGKLVAWMSKYASHITLVSHSEEQLISQALGADSLPKRYQVIYNGVIDRVVEPAERSAADKDAYVYCATSRLVTAKGIGELIDAFGRLYAEHSDCRLWLVGDGPEAARFQDSAKNKPGIVFHGHQDHPLDLAAASDVFVHPSYHEGFSISLIEAAMLGKPIVACDVGGNPEIVSQRQTGLLVPAREVQPLYEAMKQLYDDRRLADDLGDNARQRFEQDFNFEHIVQQGFVSVYEH